VDGVHVGDHFGGKKGCILSEGWKYQVLRGEQVRGVGVDRVEKVLEWGEGGSGASGVSEGRGRLIVSLKQDG